MFGNSHCAERAVATAVASFLPFQAVACTHPPAEREDEGARLNKAADLGGPCAAACLAVKGKIAHIAKTLATASALEAVECQQSRGGRNCEDL